MATKSAHQEKTPPTVLVRGKYYRLFERSGSGSPWWFRVQTKGKRLSKSTDTADLKLAKERAKIAIIDLLDGRVARAEEGVAKRKKITTIGEILDFAANSHLAVNANTMKEYERALLLILRTVMDLDNEQARRQKLDVLTAELARSYQAKMQGLNRAEVKKLTEGNTNANAKLRFARSLFSKQRILDYKEAGFVIPDCLQSFLSVPYLQEESHRYSDNPIPQIAILKMDKALPALKEQDERLWAIHLMIRLMGLRDSEIERAQDTWLTSTKVKGKNHVEMRIIKRTGEAMPKRSEGVVAVPPDLVEFFTKQKGHLIPAKTPTERHNLIYRQHNTWLRKFIPNREKGAHELRKHFGSVWATKTGSLYEAAHRLRVSLQVAEYHYSAMLKKPEALSLDDYKGMVS